MIRFITRTMLPYNITYYHCRIAYTYFIPLRRFNTCFAVRSSPSTTFAHLVGSSMRSLPTMIQTRNVPSAFASLANIGDDFFFVLQNSVSPLVWDDIELCKDNAPMSCCLNEGNSVTSNSGDSERLRFCEDDEAATGAREGEG